MYRNSRDSVPEQQRRIKPTRRSVSGSYAFRGNSEVQFESTLERDFIMLADFNINVLDIIPQPASISFRGINGQELVLPSISMRVLLTVRQAICRGTCHHH